MRQEAEQEHFIISPKTALGLLPTESKTIMPEQQLPSNIPLIDKSGIGFKTAGAILNLIKTSFFNDTYVIRNYVFPILIALINNNTKSMAAIALDLSTTTLAGLGLAFLYTMNLQGSPLAGGPQKIRKRRIKTF